MLESIISIVLSMGIVATPIQAEVSAYAPLDNKSGMCADSTPTVTSKGFYPSRDIVAVDPREIPYGTLLFIPGHGYAIAGDTGSHLRKNKKVGIDIFRSSYEEAIQWGRKRDYTIYVYFSKETKP